MIKQAALAVIQTFREMCTNSGQYEHNFGESTTDTQPEDDVPSLDVAFDLTREQCAAQLTHLNGLDTKAGFVLASASLLTGALATWRVPTTTVHYPIFIEWFMMRIPLISIVIYLVVIVTSYFALIPRDFTISINPTHLWQNYSKKPERWTKRKVRATMAAIYQKNKQVIDRKIRWTMAAFFALALEAVLVAVILFFQTGG